MINRLATKTLPLPTPQEQIELDRYVSRMNEWRNAQAGGVDQAASDAAANAMAEIEAMAIQNHGRDNPLSRLWEHLESMTGFRAGTMSAPIRVTPATETYVEGFGRRFNTESTRFGSFRGMTYTRIRQAIGRPPDRVNGRFPERVRITWEFADGSAIHVDVPGTKTPAATRSTASRTWPGRPANRTPSCTSPMTGSACPRTPLPRTRPSRRTPCSPR